MSYRFGARRVPALGYAFLTLFLISFSTSFHSKLGYAEKTESFSAADPESDALGAEAHATAEFPLLKRTRGGRGAVVRRGMFKKSAAMARVYPGAVLQLRRRGRSSSCPAGWLERKGGGFICGYYLKSTAEKTAHPAPMDDPNLLEGLDAFEVVNKRALLYRKLKDIDRRHANNSLRPSSVIVTKQKITRRGLDYFETRKGWFIEAEHLKKLPPPVRLLGIDIRAHEDLPGAIVVSLNARAYAQPEDRSESLRNLERWSAIRGRDGESLTARDGWVELGDGSFVDDDDLARVRRAPRPRQLGRDERWIAVDVAEQLLHAYEGERLVRIVPCSTGRRGNTEPGRYRIQWKRRAQTMRLRAGQIRVEDVQWVMYYHRREGIAIHSAYWHHNFGRPVSHGCVNLPIDDARWLFEWATPHALPEDSERFPSPGKPGSRVVVFK